MRDRDENLIELLKDYEKQYKMIIQSVVFIVNLSLIVNNIFYIMFAYYTLWGWIWDVLFI